MATYHHMCSICLEDFKQPKFLECFHTFCLECLRGLENKTPGYINCPLCQREVKLPSGGVDKLTTNFYIDSPPLVEVEDGKTVSRRPSTDSGPLPYALSTYSGSRHRHEALQTAARSQQQIGRQSKTDTREQNEHKLLQMYYDIRNKNIPKISQLSFCRIMFDLFLFRSSNDTLTLSIGLSPTNEFIHSCDIDNDITFINKKDSEFSIRTIGKGYIQSAQGYPYQCKTVGEDLIRRQDAVNDKNGFIVKRSEFGFEYTFQLSIAITVSNVKKVNFYL